MRQKNVFLLMLLAVVVSFTACKKQAKTETTEERSTEIVDMHNAQNSLDWMGTYEGVLPCADCPGIQTTIELNEDNTFVRTSVYMERDVEPMIEKGSFVWEADGMTITLKAEELTYKARVREGNILLLNTDGTEITGDLAEHYILNKK